MNLDDAAYDYPEAFHVHCARVTRAGRNTMITQEAADKFGEIDLSKISTGKPATGKHPALGAPYGTMMQEKRAQLTPKAWVESNRQWKRIDNIDHAKFQLGRPSSNKVFWNSVLELLGAQ